MQTLHYQPLSERLKSACKILFGNWIKVMLFPLALYFGIFLLSLLSKIIEDFFPNLFDNLWVASFYSLIILGIVIVAFFIPNISILLSTSQILQNRKTTLFNLIKNTFSLFGRFLKITFWIFTYLGLIPLIFLAASTGVYIISPVIGAVLFTLTKIFTIVFFIIRLPRIIISLSLGVLETKLNTKEIVQNSREISQGNWWKILGNMAIISLISFVLTGINYAIRYLIKYTLIFSPKIFSIISACVDIFFQTHILAFTLIFLFLLTLQLKASKPEPRK